MLIFSHALPVTADELYYKAWSDHLQWSYFDHPPMVAYLNWVAQLLLGHHVNALRVMSLLVTCFVLGWLSVKTPFTTFPYLLLTPFAFWGGMLMTPDVPLALFWVLYFSWWLKAEADLRQFAKDPVARVYRYSPVSPGRWMGGGIWLGLGLLSKYPMVLAVGSAAFLLLRTPLPFRYWRGFLLQLAVAFCFTLPIWIYNKPLHYAPLLFQLHHAASSTARWEWISFWGSLCVLVGFWPFYVLLRWLFSPQRFRDGANLVCFAFFVVPFVFILGQSLTKHVEANWALPSFLTVWPLVDKLLPAPRFGRFHVSRGTLLSLGFLPAFLATILLGLALLFPGKIISPVRDRIARFRAENTLAERVAFDVERLKKKELEPVSFALPLYAPSYQWVSCLRNVGLPAQQLYPPGRMSHFTIPVSHPCDARHVLFFIEKHQEDTLPSCFSLRQPLKNYDLKVGEVTLNQWSLIYAAW